MLWPWRFINPYTDERLQHCELRVTEAGECRNSVRIRILRGRCCGWPSLRAIATGRRCERAAVVVRNRLRRLSCSRPAVAVQTQLFNVKARPHVRKFGGGGDAGVVVISCIWKGSYRRLMK